MDDIETHKHFDEFLKKNEYYANSLDFVLEDYYAIFKAGFESGYNSSMDNLSVYDGDSWREYWSQEP